MTKAQSPTVQGKNLSREDFGKMMPSSLILKDRKSLASKEKQYLGHRKMTEKHKSKFNILRMASFMDNEAKNLNYPVSTRVPLR